MDKKRDYWDETKFISFIKLFFGVLLFLMALFFVVGEIVMPDERESFNTECNEFVSDWYQVMDDGEKVPVEMPGKVNSQKGEVVTLSTTLTEDIKGSEVLCFRPIWQDVEVYVDDELRACYNTKESRPFGKNSAFRYVFADISDEDIGKELVYKFTSDSKYTGTMRVVRIGDKLGVLEYLIKESGMKTIITIFLLFLSVFCILVCTILKYIYKKRLSLSYLVWTILFASIWMLSEVEFRQLIFKNVSVLTNFTYFSLMIIPIPLMLYIDEIQGCHYTKIHLFPMGYATVTFIVCTALQVLNIEDFVQMLPYMHFGILISIVITIITIVIDIVKKRISEYLVVGVGVCGLLLSALFEMLFYYLDTYVSIGTFLAIGLMFLLVMAILKTGQDLMRSEKKKQQAIVARESQAKFLANMSHEIRTPINAVIGMNEMILRENKDAAIKEYAGNIKRASNMLLGLISDILDFSKIESGQFEIVEDTYNLVSMVKDAKLILNTRASEKQISTIINVDSNLPSKLYGDELRIKQIVTNIISNAVKYTNEGSVTLKVFGHKIDEEYVRLCVSVTDTGIGIKQEDMKELFDNFKRLELDKNRNIQGTGLGLSIAKQLVELMHGEITVQSVYGKGSTFTIAIPQKIMDKKVIGNIEEVINKDNEDNTVEKNRFIAPNAKVLIVDDNAMNISVIKALLKRTEIKVDSVTSGKECLELTKTNKYDMILLDHMMPEMDGVATLKKIREDNSNPNQNGIIIALTANAVVGCREMYLEYGFSDYFSKPIQADKMDAMLIEYLPKGLIMMEKNINELLEIDRKVGLSYCMDSEDIYKDVIGFYCEQCEEYFIKLDECIKSKDWNQYAIIAHAIKSNSLNIGAVNFSNLSLKHEMAAKNGDFNYIEAEYNDYVAILRKLVDKVSKEK